MRFIAMALVSLAAILGLAAPASADTPNCVTAREFSRVHLGQTRAHVRRVFDVRGHRAFLGNDPMTAFHACGGGTAWVEFERQGRAHIVEQKVRRF
jgi:hypothetical protein